MDGGASNANAVAHAAFGALWAVVGTIACAAMIGLEPNLVEEGLLIHFAERMAEGEHLYRDLVFFTGPLPFELLAQLFRWFGAEIEVGRIAAAAIHGVNAAAAYGLVQRAGSGPLAHASGALVAVLPILLFPLFSIFYYTPLAFSFGLASAYATLRGVDSMPWAFVAGLGIAAVALCKQTLGVVLALSLLAALFVSTPAERRLRQSGAVVASGLLAAIATVGFYAWRGDLSDLWRCLVTIPLTLEESFTSRYMNLWPIGVLADYLKPHKVIYFPNLYYLRHGVYAHLPATLVATVQVLYALPLAALLVTALARLRGPLPAPVWINGAFLLAMTSNLYPRADWGHLVYSLPPAVLQLAILVSPWFARRRLLAPALALGLCAAIGWSAFQLGSFVHGEAGPPIWGDKVKLRPVSAIYRIVTFPRVIRYLAAAAEPGEEIFVARSEPLLYHATGTRNPTPYGGVMTGIKEEQQDEILEALARIRFVVMSDLDQPMWTYYSEELPRVQEYLERHYHIADGYPLDDASWVLVLQRGKDRGETWLDLFEQREQAEAWILDRDRKRVPDDQEPPRLVARQNRRPMPMRLGPWGGGLDYELRVPEGARFEADVGYRGMVSLDALHDHPRRSHMVVEVGRNGGFEEVARQKVDDSKGGGRKWIPVSVDLSKYAGETITLRLTIDVAIRTDGHELSWWASPRIVVDPAIAPATLPADLDSL
jgi:hypothetical protein